MTKYVIVGGGWAGTSKTGETFVRLKFKSPIPSETMVTMWKNKHKDTDKHPDYLVMAAVHGDEKPTLPDKFF